MNEANKKNVQLEETVVCSLYRFVKLNNHEALREPLLKLLQKLQVKGSLLLAHEGLNGTIAGSREAINQVIVFLKKDGRFDGLQIKESKTNTSPFKRTKVKVKKEIVTMGRPDIDPQHYAGEYVKPEDWNDLISDPNVVVIDTRNEYEIAVGSFDGAVNPQTTTFREFPLFAKTLNLHKSTKVAMYCTGGIRCEKSTAYLKSLGFDNVYHLEGGILKYLEETPEDNSLWKGECFVFDDRVTVNHQLHQGSYDQCHACRTPISQKDKQSPYFTEGISCHHCYKNLTEKRRKRLQERQKQVRLARQRGDSHIGSDASEAHRSLKVKKLKRKVMQRNESG